MKRKDYYPSYIPRKWIHFAEHGRKYRIRKKELTSETSSLPNMR